MALTKVDNSSISSDFGAVGISSAAVPFGSSAAITPDLSESKLFTWAITSNKTLNLPTTNIGSGFWYILVTNDSTGGWGISLDSEYNRVGATAYDNTANYSNLITISSNGSRYDVWFQSLGVVPYEITNSIVLDGSSEYLYRTPAGSGNQKTWTWSAWVKRSGLGSVQTLFDSRATPAVSTTPATLLRFTAADKLEFYDFDSVPATQCNLVTTALFRDPAAWYHIVLAVDTTAGTASDRAKLYVNGTEITALDTNTYYDLNDTTQVSNNVQFKLGAKRTDADALDSYFDGYMSDIVLVDGTATTAGSFGQTDDNGVWTPKNTALSNLTFGTNGFWLTHSQNSHPGTDNSGSGNRFVLANMNTANISKDSPSHNYSTWNPVDETGAVLTNGNTTFAGVSNVSNWTTRSTFAVSSGKWYYEVTAPATITGVTRIGWQNTNEAMAAMASPAAGAGTYVVAVATGNKENNGSASAYGSAIVAKDVVMIAIDLDNGKVWMGKNGTWFNSGNPVAGTNEAYSSISGLFSPVISTGDTNAWNTNFGSEQLIYTPPVGFKTLSTSNMPAPDITDASAYFQPHIYTGTGSAHSEVLTGNSALQPDLVWIKNRDTIDEHKVVDAVRGATNELNTDSDNAETTDANGVTAFTASGFTLGSGAAGYNDSTEDFIAWCWKESASAGFDIVEYSGDNTSNKSINHNLGIAPDFALVKRTDSAENWFAWHRELSGNTYFLTLDSNSAESNTDSPWGTGNWSTTQFMITNNATNNTNATGTGNYIAYLWSSIDRFSKFGSYVGNADDDGPFVHLGFRPALLIVKQADGTGQWVMHDSARDTNNLTTQLIMADATTAEATGTDDVLDMNSNGFKIRDASSVLNTTGQVYIYMAWAEYPFGGSSINETGAR